MRFINVRAVFKGECDTLLRSLSRALRYIGLVARTFRCLSIIKTIAEQYYRCAFYIFYNLLRICRYHKTPSHRVMAGVNAFREREHFTVYLHLPALNTTKCSNNVENIYL